MMPELERKPSKRQLPWPKRIPELEREPEREPPKRHKLHQSNVKPMMKPVQGLLEDGVADAVPEMSNLIKRTKR